MELDSEMPVAALIDSGNKSLHAWIRVDAPDDKEYKRRVGVVWDWFSGLNLDKQNRNPSRLSRCPDGWRTVDEEPRQQKLLALKFGTESWDAWEAGHSKEPSSLFIDLKPFIENGCQPELPTIADVGLDKCLLYAGRMNEIHGEPGTGKSNVEDQTGSSVTGTASGNAATCGYRHSRRRRIHQCQRRPETSRPRQPHRFAKSTSPPQDGNPMA